MDVTSMSSLSLFREKNSFSLPPIDVFTVPFNFFARGRDCFAISGDTLPDVCGTEFNSWSLGPVTDNTASDSIGSRTPNAVSSYPLTSDSTSVSYLALSSFSSSASCSKPTTSRSITRPGNSIAPFLKSVHSSCPFDLGERPSFLLVLDSDEAVDYLQTRFFLPNLLKPLCR